MKVKFPPKEHQIKAIKFCLERNRAFVCYKTGSGKSYIMLSVAYMQMEHYDIDGVILVATNSAIRSLIDEMKKTFSTEPITFEELLRGKKGVFLIAYQNVNTEWIRKLPVGKYTLILDEYHKVKSSKTNTTKMCNKLKAKCVNRYGFTATPIMKEFRDLFELIKWLNPMVLGTWQEFCDNYTLYYKIPTDKGFDILKPYKYRNFEKLKRTLSNIMITYFPDSNIKWKEYMIPLEDVEGYRKTREDALIPTGDEQKDKALPMQAVKKCKHFVAVSKSKMVQLYKIVKEHINRGVIVYCDEYYTFNPVYKFLTKICGFNVLKYSGISSQKEKDRSFSEFKEDASNKVLLLSRVGGASLNLQSTNHLVMFDMPSSLGSVQQLAGRTDRMDSIYGEEGFYMHLLITATSVEQYWLEYIKLYDEPLRKLFNNGSLPQGMPSYNEFIKKKLINDKVWNR